MQPTTPSTLFRVPPLTALDKLALATVLLQLGELEGKRINEAAERDIALATWHDDPALGVIADIAVKQPRPLCDALFLLLDGWFRYQQDQQGMATVTASPGSPEQSEHTGR